MSGTDRLSLLTDNLDVTDASICIFNANPRPGYAVFGPAMFTQTSKPIYDRALQYRLKPDDGAPLGLAIVEITRNKIQTLGLVAQAYHRLNASGILIVNGDKLDGIESHLKTLRKHFNIEDVVSKSHGKVFQISKGETPDILKDWEAASKPQKNMDGYLTQAGIFSSDHIDNGSFFLAEVLPALSGRVADLGGGWGYLSEKALEKSEDITELHLVEADQNALECAMVNLSDQRVQFHWADALQFEADPFDAIIMNPPFHQSRKSDTGLGKQFVQSAARLLKPNGVLWMVANRQLAYEDTLKTRFGSGQIVQESPQFKIIRAEKPKR